MTIKDVDIEKAASLAHISLKAEHTQTLIQDVTNIIDFMKKLQSVDTKGISPLQHPIDIEQRLRNDIPDLTSKLSQLENIAPEFHEGHYLVPKVIDKKGN